MEKYVDAIKQLKLMGIKVILATGVKDEVARKIALRTGILAEKHQNICGALIHGKDLKKIYFGADSAQSFQITPEYLSVVCRASLDDRAMLVDYLSRFNPGRSSTNSPYGFGSDTPRAIVAALGSGDNDVKMLKKAKVSFSTNLQAHHDAKEAADIILMTNQLEDVVICVAMGREYKDHFMKLIMLQLPCSVTAVALIIA